MARPRLCQLQRRDQWRADGADGADCRGPHSRRGRHPVARHDGRWVQGRRSVNGRDRRRDHGDGDAGRVAPRRCCAQKLVITQEPVFYSAGDEPGNRRQDPVYLAKMAFVGEQRLVVWRFSDHWIARTPNEAATALAARLGWAGYRSAGAEQIYQVPETTLGALIQHVRTRLGLRGGLRAVGEARMRVRNVFVNPGAATVASTVAALRRADVILTGEPREWEVVPYALDTWANDRGKGMIAVGRLVSESPGMEACAAWVRALVPEVRVETLAVADPVLESTFMTAEQIVARIQKALLDKGIAWRAQTVDTFKAGAPAADVKGIATTGMATLDVLHRAARAGRNFVITHEPTFYNHTDQTTGLENDPTYQAKQRFIERSEHGDLSLPRSRPRAAARSARRWIGAHARVAQYASAAEPRIYVLPRTTLGALATDIAQRLNSRAIRVAGDPAMVVTRIALGPGYGVPALTAAVDVAVGGEASESGGNAAYALDAAATGQTSGVILLGHMMSEDFGMKEVAEWLRPLVPDVPVDWIPAGEPFS